MGPEDVRHLKPAPDMVLLAVRRLGVSPGQTVCGGGLTVEVEGARAAGVTVWVVATGSDRRETLAAGKPDRLFERLSEVAEALASQGADRINSRMTHLDGDAGSVAYG